jgi:16S rRNA (uracil1498-N3)-methyltransferase
MNLKIHNLFYAPREKIYANEITVDGDEFHHIKNVLRKKSGTVIFFTDGKGYSYQTEIIETKKNVIKAKVLRKKWHKRIRKVNIDLAFVPLKGTRNNFIFEKGTELGVRKFLPFISEFSVIPKLDMKKIERFKKISISAMLQSQQYYAPEIIFYPTVNDLIKKSNDCDLVLLADKNGYAHIPAGAKSVLYIVGSEGGFNDEEIEIFKKNGARLLSLGQNRFRSETAAIAGLVKILTLYGEI